VHGDIRELVHAAQVVAGMPVHFHLQWSIQAGGDRMRAVGIEDPHGLHARGRRLAVQPVVHLAQRRRGQIE
jgi:hypothetical protein